MESNLLLIDQDLQSGRTGSLRDDLREVGSAVRQMKQLVVELLELARIGRLDLLAAAHSRETEEVPLELVVDEVVRQLRTANPGFSGVLLRVSALPVVRARRSQLAEVFQNLIDNAVKYTANAPGSRIEIGCEERDIGRVLFVRDNGVGIPASDRLRVFDVFIQLHPDATGNGIGLSIVRSIIAGHGGRVWIEDGLNGRGVSFCFTLHSLTSTD
jgi:signal transduction histidine kinase